jgi:hypothetical protein
MKQKTPFLLCGSVGFGQVAAGGVDAGKGKFDDGETGTKLLLTALAISR